MTHRDCNGVDYCYDDHLEKIRVTNLYGIGREYTRMDDCKDFLFEKIGWESEYASIKKPNSGGCMACLEEHVTYQTYDIFDHERSKDNERYHEWKAIDAQNR